MWCESFGLDQRGLVPEKNLGTWEVLWKRFWTRLDSERLLCGPFFLLGAVATRTRVTRTTSLKRIMVVVVVLSLCLALCLLQQTPRLVAWASPLERETRALFLYLCLCLYPSALEVIRVVGGSGHDAMRKQVVDVPERRESQWRVRHPLFWPTPLVLERSTCFTKSSLIVLVATLHHARVHWLSWVVVAVSRPRSCFSVSSGTFCATSASLSPPRQSPLGDNLLDRNNSLADVDVPRNCRPDLVVPFSACAETPLKFPDRRPVLTIHAPCLG